MSIQTANKLSQGWFVTLLIFVFCCVTAVVVSTAFVLFGLNAKDQEITQLRVELEASEQKYDELLASTELADKSLELMKETDILGSLDNVTELAETFQDVDVSGHSEELQKYVNMYKELQEAN